MQRITITKFIGKLALLMVLFFLFSKFSVMFYFKDVPIPYNPVFHNDIMFYEKTNDNLGIDICDFMEKMEQFVWNNEAVLLSKDFLDLQGDYEEISYCVMMRSSHYSFRVNALYNALTKKVQQIAVYSYGSELWDYNSHMCLLYLWSCINTDAVSEDNMKFLQEKSFYFPSNRLINGIMYYRVPLRSTKYGKYPEIFVLCIDVSCVRDEVNRSYMVNTNEM